MLVCNIPGIDTRMWSTELEKDRVHFPDEAREEVHQSCQTYIFAV